MAERIGEIQASDGVVEHQGADRVGSNGRAIPHDVMEIIAGIKASFNGSRTTVATPQVPYRETWVDLMNA